jgi:selenocysteine lyase/cysteine desulfurase
MDDGRSTEELIGDLAAHFGRFRPNIVGADARIATPCGERSLICADWTASGRLYGPIEQCLADDIGPFVANTHSEASATGALMTSAYREAHEIIRRHVNASPEDVVITAGAGMTTVVNKLIRLLGLRVPEQLAGDLSLPADRRPVVFVTHMEHHSNQTPWIETIADVIVLPPDEAGLVDVSVLSERLDQYRDRPLKIGAFTACSNVSGIRTPLHDLAEVMHAHGGVCFADFAASAPYVDIDMHPGRPGTHLDAVYFSPHKFLGGPGASGVLVFNAALYANRVPDQPGGGTVEWTNPWLEHRDIANIEVREDGGTPGFLQAIRAALAIRLKDQLGTERMLRREHTQVRRLEGVDAIARSGGKWAEDYVYSAATNEFRHGRAAPDDMAARWFALQEPAGV